MPDYPADYEEFLPVDDRDDHFVTVQMPRSALRAMERDARAHRQAMAEQADADAGRDDHGDALLEEGERDFRRERNALATNSPGDRQTDPDPYREAQRVFDREIDEGRQQKHAAGAALNVLVNAAQRGDRRVIIPSRSTQALG